MPVSLAWSAFGEANGVRSLVEMRARIAKYRREAGNANPDIGCIMLAEPFFFQENDWIPAPADWASSIVSGKTYSDDTQIGAMLWGAVQERLAASLAKIANVQPQSQQPRDRDSDLRNWCYRDSVREPSEYWSPMHMIGDALSLRKVQRLMGNVIRFICSWRKLPRRNRKIIE